MSHMTRPKRVADVDGYEHLNTAALLAQINQFLEEDKVVSA